MTLWEGAIVRWVASVNAGGLVFLGSTPFICPHIVRWTARPTAVLRFGVHDRDECCEGISARYGRRVRPVALEGSN
ncbi:MAG: hypothetical protein RLZZ536_1906 [Planctomycetota bacterium]|jgi:hypothetical protein